MPRTSLVPAGLAAEFDALLRRLAAACKDAGREEALAQMRAVFDGAAPRRGLGRPRGSKNKPKASKPARRKSGRKRKNPWTGLSPEARLKRINAIRKGRGLPTKDKL